MKSSGLRLSWFLLGLMIVAVAFVLNLHDVKIFFRSYLFGFLFWSDLPLGAFFLVMTFHLTGGKWGERSQGVLEVLSATLLIVALMSVPIFFGLEKIYSWTDPAVTAVKEIFHKRRYLNEATFIVRSLFYFASWLTLNHFRRKWARDQSKLSVISGPGMVWVGFTVTFAAIDWQMSVEPFWYSTIYGMVFAIGEALTAFSLALVILGIVSKGRDVSSSFSAKTLRDLGNILLTLVILWAYLSFAQFLVIWSGNLPHEVPWFIRRSEKGWQWLALLLFLFQFSLPFFVLLFRASKNSLQRLAKIAAVIFSVRIVDHYWMLMPGFDGTPRDGILSSILIWSGLGFIVFSFLAPRLQGVRDA